MSAVPVTLRCVRCGRLLAAPAPASEETGWVSCPHCGHPTPVVAPRDPAPLFSWEVFPHLYPALPPPHAPRGGPALVGILVAATVLLSGLAGGLAYEGAASFAPGPFGVHGNVVRATFRGGTAPIVGATVIAHGETGPSSSSTTNASGAFRCVGIGPGRVSLDVSAPGYYRASFELFVSATYSTAGSESDPIAITLVPFSSSANRTAGAALNVTPFADLESFIASLWSATGLLGTGAILAALGAVLQAHGRRPALVAVGGAGGLLAPLSIFALGVNAAFPLATPLAALTMGVGGSGLFLQAYRMSRAPEAPEPE